MSGFGGITVLLLPDGVTYYIFTDGAQFHGYGAANEINKIAPFCSQECQSPRISHGGPGSAAIARRAANAAGTRMSPESVPVDHRDRPRWAFAMAAFSCSSFRQASRSRELNTVYSAGVGLT